MRKQILNFINKIKTNKIFSRIGNISVKLIKKSKKIVKTIRSSSLYINLKLKLALLFESFKEGTVHFKNPAPILTLFFLLIFGYNLFLKKNKVKEIPVEEVVTADLRYIGKDFKFFSRRTVDKGGNRSFYDIEIEYEDSKIRAGYAVLQKDENIVFKNNVEGEGKGWTFQANEARYSKINGDIVFSLYKDVTAHSDAKKLNIKANNFRLNDNFAKVKLSEDVVIYNEDSNVQISCQNAHIEDDFLFAKDSVEIELIENINGKEETIVLATKELDYNIKEDKTVSEEEYSITFQEYSLKGVGFKFEKGNFETESELEISDKKDGKATALTLKYIDKKMTILKANGKIDNINISALEIENKDNRTKLIGKARLASEEYDLNADEIELHDNKIFALGSVTVNSNEYLLKAENLEYDRESSKLICKNSHIIKEKGREKGKEIENTVSEYLEYSKDKSGIMKKASIELKEYKVYADSIMFDLENKKHNLVGNVKLVNNDLTLMPQSINVDNDVIRLNGLVILEKSDLKLSFNDGIYDEKEKIFSSDSEVKGGKGKFTFESKGILYNTDKEEMHFKDKFRLKDKNLDFISDSAIYDKKAGQINFPNPKGSGSSFTYSAKHAKYVEKDDTLLLIGDVVVVKDDLSINSPQIAFELEKEILSFDQETIMYRKDFLVIAERGKFFINDEIGSFEDISLIKDEGDVISAKYVEMDKKMESIFAKQDVIGEIGSNMSFRADKGRIFFVDNKEDNYSVEKSRMTRAELFSNIQFRYADLKISSNYLEYDNAISKKQGEIIFAKDNLKVKIELPEGSADITAKYAFYELGKEIGRLRQNVTVTYKNLDNIINAKGDEGIHENKNKIVSLLGNVHASSMKNNLDLTGDDVELNMNTGIIKSKGNARFKYKLNEKELINSDFSEEIKEIDEIKKGFLDNESEK